MSLMGKPAKSTSGSAQAWAQPYASQAAQDVLSVYNAQQPNLDAIQGNVAGQLSNLGQQGTALGAQGAQFNKAAGSGAKFENQVINGQFMSGNPYIQNVLSQLDQSILDGVNSGFESGGRYGSGAYVGELGKQLGNANMQLLYGNYSDEMNRRMQASQQADQALQGQQAAQAQNAQQQLAAAQLAAQIPYTGVNAVGNSLGALFNGGTSTGPTQGLIGSIGAIGAGLASNPLLFK